MHGDWRQSVRTTLIDGIAADCCLASTLGRNAPSGAGAGPKP